MPTPPHRRTFFYLLLLTEGGGKQSWGLHEYEVSAPMLCCTSPTQITAIQSIAPATRGWFCMFNDAFFLHNGSTPVILRGLPI